LVEGLFEGKDSTFGVELILDHRSATCLNDPTRRCRLWNIHRPDVPYEGVDGVDESRMVFMVG